MSVAISRDSSRVCSSSSRLARFACSPASSSSWLSERNKYYTVKSELMVDIESRLTSVYCRVEELLGNFEGSAGFRHVVRFSLLQFFGPDLECSSVSNLVASKYKVVDLPLRN